LRAVVRLTSLLLVLGTFVGPADAGAAETEITGPTAAALPPDDAVVALANTRGIVCSGALVGASTVLTARHCLPIAEVRFGGDARTPARRIPVVAARTPPFAAADLALLRLRERQSTPAPLPIATEPNPPIGVVRLVGYGAVGAHGEARTDLRHHADVQVRGWGCSGRAAEIGGCADGLEMAIPRAAGADTCSGDSGGPVLEHAAGGFRILAVTSRALRGGILPCGDGGIYTRTDRLSGWARAVIAEWEGPAR
jgi:hypothetical protein